MKKYVVYTANIGNYDNIVQPQVLHDEFDFILFTDAIKESKIGVWETKNADYSHHDKTRISRWLKTHPEKLVNNYVFSIWIDSNIQIKSIDFYLRAIELYQNGEVISSMWHNERDCIYDEAAVVAYDNLDSEKNILDWEHKLLKEKYPQHHGLFETNVLYRNHHDSKICQFDDLWWSAIDSFSRRDQLSFNYALWKLGINCPYYLSLGENTRNSEHVKLCPHNNSSNRYYKKSDNRIVQYFRLMSTDKERLGNIYKSISSYPCRHITAFFIGNYFRFLYYFRLFLRRIQS